MSTVAAVPAAVADLIAQVADRVAARRAHAAESEDARSEGTEMLKRFMRLTQNCAERHERANKLAAEPALMRAVTACLEHGCVPGAPEGEPFSVTRVFDYVAQHCDAATCASALTADAWDALLDYVEQSGSGNAEADCAMAARLFIDRGLLAGLDSAVTASRLTAKAAPADDRRVEHAKAMAEAAAAAAE